MSLFGLGQTVPWSSVHGAGDAAVRGLFEHAPGWPSGVEISFADLFAAWLDPGTLALGLLLWRFVSFYRYLLLDAPVFAITTGRMTRKLLEGDLAASSQSGLTGSGDSRLR